MKMTNSECSFPLIQFVEQSVFLKKTQTLRVNVRKRSHTLNPHILYKKSIESREKEFREDMSVRRTLNAEVV
ncbi:Hypothetical predicted protein [Octopus vulgaris]|uniref:Uncharacterized protein n=1 Tax=Octopus vulgaris TaxID=6645 RepID=A0AA36FDX8_OCTVU|nr:Hypothetical predicted protein [Octopus vulgaris]